MHAIHDFVGLFQTPVDFQVFLLEEGVVFFERVEAKMQCLQLL